MHFGVGFGKLHVDLGKAKLNFSKSVVQVGTNVGKLGAHFGTDVCEFGVHVGTNVGKLGAHFCTYVGKLGAHFVAYVCELGSNLFANLSELPGYLGSGVGKLHSNFGTEVGEFEFHLGLGENNRCGDVVFGCEAVPVNGRNGVHQLGRVFFAKDANEFVRDAKPSCFIKCHYFAFRFWMQVNFFVTV